MKLLKYDISDNVTAFTTTREGGCSIGNYGAFNVNWYCGDNPAHIEANKEILCKELGIATDRLIMPHQTHQTNVALIDSKFLTLNAEEQKDALEGVDALITKEHKVTIGVSTADCVPVLVYDFKNQIAAAIHAGWRGTVQRIVEVTLDKMNTEFGTIGCDCKAIIGPSISLDSFEVGDEVYDAFDVAGFEMKKIAKKYKKISKVDNSDELRWHIDLWECNRLQLLHKGLNPENIIVSGICTYKNSDKFFSARKQTIKSGRLLTGILIK